MSLSPTGSAADHVPFWSGLSARFVVATAAMLLAGLFVLWPVLETPYTGDDIRDSQLSADLAWNDTTTAEHARTLERDLRVEEGRFLPVAELENVVIFDAVQHRAPYKALQVGIVVVVIMLLGTFVALFAKSGWAGLATSALLIPGLQLRLWDDPIHSGGLLMPSLVAKLLVAWILTLLALRSTRFLIFTPCLVVAAGLQVAAVTQYEVAYLVVPVAGLIVWHERYADLGRRLAVLGALLVPAFLLGDYVVTLRSFADPLPANLSNPVLDAALPAFVHQVLGSFPLSASVFRGTGVPGVWDSFSQSGAGGLFVGVAMGVVVVCAIREWRPSSGRTVVALVSIGLLVVVGPALPTSLSLRWQEELDWGLVNLPVFLQALGMAALLASLFVGLRCGLDWFVRLGLVPEPPQWTRIAGYASLGLFVVFATCTAGTGNRWVADELQDVRARQDLILASIDAGLFERVGDGVRVVAHSVDDYGYFNEQYLAWRGAPSGLVVQGELPKRITSCGAVGTCDDVGNRLFLLQEFAGVDGRTLLLAPLVAHGDPVVAPTILLDEAVLIGRADGADECPVTNSGSKVSSAVDTNSDWVLHECEGPPVSLEEVADSFGSGEPVASDLLMATTLNEAIDAGALRGIDDGSVVVTNLLALTDDLAGVYVAWRGGPSAVRFTTEIPTGSSQCSEIQVCGPDGQPIRQLREIPVGDGDTVLLQAPVAGDTGNPVDPLIVIGHTTLFGPASKVRTCDMHGPEPGHIPESDDIWATRQCSGPPSTASTFSQWVGSGCTEEIKGWFICTD